MPTPLVTGAPATGSRTSSLLRAHLGPLLVLVPMAFVEVALDGGLTLSYRYLIDEAIVPANGRVLVLVLCALAAGATVSSVISILRDRVYARRVAKILEEVRHAVFEHVQRLSSASIAARRSGDIVARFSTDLAGLEGALVGAVGGILLPGLGVVVGVALLFIVLDWKIALGAAVVWPMVLLGPRIVAPRAASAAYEKKEREAELLVTVDEIVAAHRTIKAFGLGDFVRARFQDSVSRTTAATARAAFLSALVERTTVVTIYAMQIAAVAAGALLAFHRQVSVGAFVSFLTIFWNVGWSVVVMGRSAPSLVAAWGSARRVDELLREPTDPADVPGLPPLAPLKGTIRLDDVTFAYDPKNVALLFATLDITAGESVAFVGASGSGKSTVMALIARFYDPTQGRVLFDGIDARTTSAASAREQMALVMQESFLFDISIRENIRMGRLGASDEEVEAAAREAEVHDAITAMPEGYGTHAGERGGRLSGGQRQRIAIARALLRKPKILLLDEASSALDSVSEAAINATLARAGRGRTTISVTHRLAGITRADRIFVVGNKRILEQGTHDELLARGRAYAELWGKQSGFVLSGDGAVARISVERLRAIDLFRPLEEKQLERLAATLICENARVGQRVISQGEPGSLFYLIVRGIVSVTRVEDDGREAVLARLDDGDQFGELALLRDAPRNATVTCVTDCMLLALTRQQFAELLDSTPELRAVVEKVAAARMTSMRAKNLSATLS